jgi:hypothetical protein
LITSCVSKPPQETPAKVITASAIMQPIK